MTQNPFLNAVMGYLFVYQPVRIYMEGQKEEGVKFFLTTVVSFAILMVVLLVIVLLLS